MVFEFFRRFRQHQAMTPEIYLDYFRTQAELAKRVRPRSDDDPLRYMELNLQRTLRIGRTYCPSSEVRAAAESISAKQIWVVLTEAWCGDSAQNLPYIIAIASFSSRIDVRILLRDQNLNVMDLYLTEGTRSIPKLVAFDTLGSELFRWGPRPCPAADLFRRLKESGASAEERKRRLHLWYGRNRGKALEEEFTALLSNPVRPSLRNHDM